MSEEREPTLAELQTILRNRIEKFNDRMKLLDTGRNIFYEKDINITDSIKCRVMFGCKLAGTSAVHVELQLKSGPKTVKLTEAATFVQVAVYPYLKHLEKLAGQTYERTKKDLRDLLDEEIL